MIDETTPEPRRSQTLLQHLAERLSSRWFLGNAGVVAAAILFLITAMALGGTAAEMLTMKTKLGRAEVILHECAMLIEQITDVNATARTYVTLRQPEMLARRERIKPQIAQRFVHLRELASDNPVLAREVAKAAQLTRRRIQLYDDMVNHTDPASQTTPADENRRLIASRASTAQISRVRQQAELEFQQQQAALADNMRQSMMLALLAALGAPFFGLVGVHLLKLDRENLQARELQLELMHVQRLAIMGETSAMLAHEINQPLAAAGNYLAVLRRQIGSGTSETLAGTVERVEAQIRRAVMILKKLRRFIEKRETERDLEAPNVLVEDALTLLGTIDSTVTLKTDIPSQLPPVLVDRVQLQQVLVNLMRNAIEAMQDSPRRQLELSLRATGNNTIEIALADTGPGLSPDVATRLFQPFTTTKQGGMGVGLSICQSIISQHGGRIWAEPNPAGGTIFRFTLPAAAERAAA